MRVMYLTWGETPRSYGVFNSQIIQQFIENKKQAKAGSIFHFVSAVPLIHSGLVREKFNYNYEIKKIRDNLQSEGVTFTRLPIFAPQNLVNSSKKTFSYFHLGTHKLLKKEIIAFKPDIVHCRSYHATYAALKVRDRYNLKFKVVFDGRGLWPYEIALKKNYKADSNDFKYLLEIEKYCLKYADSVVAVSDTMADYYSSVYKRRIDTIYLSTDTKLFKPNNKKDVITEEPHFCYVGALATNTWHKPKNLKELYQQLLSLFPKAKFTIVTTSNHELIKKEFSDFSGFVNYTSTHSINELNNVLETVDVGVMAYLTPKNEMEKLLASSVMAVKTAEYLAAGTPVIVNGYCGGAASVIKDNGIGATFYPDELHQLSLQKVEALFTNECRYRAIRIAKKRFDYESNAQRYTELYRGM